MLIGYDLFHDSSNRLNLMQRQGHVYWQSGSLTILEPHHANQLISHLVL